LIQGVQRLPRDRGEIRDRCRRVLADWVAHGHDELELRRLAKGPRALAPEPVDAPKKRGG
jgi:hypothetical protein